MPSAATTRPLLPLDRVGIPRGKRSTLKFVDLTDRLDLGPRWKKKKVRLTGNPSDWDLAVLEDTRSRIKKMISALKERGLEGRQEFSDFSELEKELAELIKDRQVDPRTCFDFLVKLLSHPTAWEARLSQQTREAQGQLGAGRFEKAKKNFRRVLFFKEEDPMALKGMGYCLFEEGDLRGAKSFFEKALRFAPRDGKTLQLLGKTCHRLGDKEAAKEAFNSSLALNPDHAEPYCWLGILSYEEGNEKSAIHLLQRSISLDPLNAVARFYLAQISLQNNDPLRATFQLEVVRRLDPGLTLPESDFSKALPRSSGSSSYEPHRWVLPAFSGAI